VAGDFIDRRIGDRIGLILFGSNAYLQTPLTLDRRTVKTQLYESVIGLAGDKTAIGDAIGLAVKRLQDRAAEGKILILLTDGDNTAGEFTPEQAAALAKQTDLKIYTIGIGTEYVGAFGIRRSGIDEKTLQALSVQTGGQYFRATDAQSLAKIYHYIDEIEPIAEEVESLRPVKELYYWPGGLALLLGLLILALPSGTPLFRTKPVIEQ
jgi:Ca-activated chloride channel family protein